MRENVTKHDESERGFVLVSTLWMVALISIAATAFVIANRLHIQTIANRGQIVRMEAMADGVVEATAFQIIFENRGKNINQSKKVFRDGRYIACRPNENFIAFVSVQDQNGLIDLNAASPNLLNVLFEKLGVDAVRRQNLIAALQDFRDVDDVARSGGGEMAAYKTLGRTYGPKNAQLQSVDEVEQVLGFDAALLVPLRKVVTVYAPRNGFDPQFAPPMLKRLFSVPSRQNLQTGSPVIGGPYSQFYNRGRGHLFAISVVIKAKTKGWFKRRAIVELVNNEKQLFRIISWRRSLDIENRDELIGLVDNAPRCWFNQ